MECLLNHCHEEIATDVAVIIFYATAVGAMIVFAWLSQSKTVQTAALMIAGAWIFTVLYYFYIDGPSYYAMTLTLDGLLAYQFWRMSLKQTFPVALCLLMLGEVLFLFGAAAISLDPYWIIFTLNRAFELTLAYIIGCSIYRIRKLKMPNEKATGNADLSLKFIAG